MGSKEVGWQEEVTPAEQLILLGSYWQHYMNLAAKCHQYGYPTYTKRYLFISQCFDTPQVLR